MKILELNVEITKNDLVFLNHLSMRKVWKNFFPVYFLKTVTASPSLSLKSEKSI